MINTRKVLSYLFRTKEWKNLDDLMYEIWLYTRSNDYDESYRVNSNGTIIIKDETGFERYRVTKSGNVYSNKFKIASFRTDENNSYSKNQSIIQQVFQPHKFGVLKYRKGLNKVIKTLNKRLIKSGLYD